MIAHALSSIIVQAFLLAWRAVTGGGVGLIRAAIGTPLSPILFPVVLLGLGHKMWLVARIVFWLLYLIMLIGTFHLLPLRERREPMAPQRDSND